MHLNYLNYLYEFFRVFPIILTFESVLLAIALGNNLFCWFIVIGILFNGIIWFILTKLFTKYKPEWSERPNRMHCSYIETNKPLTAGGLPSGHCQTMGFFVTWMIFGLILYDVSLIIIIPTVILLTWLAWMMMYSRAVYFKCHTWNQSIIGIMAGMISTVILICIYLLIKK